MIRFYLFSIYCLSYLFCLSAEAQSNSSSLLDRCIPETVAVLTDSGFNENSYGIVPVARGSIEVLPFETEKKCIQLALIHSESISEVWLELYDENGKLLVHDRHSGVSPIVSICSSLALGNVYAVVRVLHGQGSLGWVAGDDDEPHPLIQTLPCAWGAAGIATAGVYQRRLIEEEPRTILESTLRMHDIRDASIRTISTHINESRAVNFDTNAGCYLIFVSASSSHLSGLNIGIQRQDGFDTISPNQAGVIPVVACTEQSTLSIHIGGDVSANWAVALSDIHISREDIASLLDIRTQSLLAWEIAKTRARGFERASRSVAYVSSDRLPTAILMDPHECAAIVVASDRGQIALSWTDEQGRLFSLDHRGAKIATAWHCAGQSQEVTFAWVRGFTAERQTTIIEVFRRQNRLPSL